MKSVTSSDGLETRSSKLTQPGPPFSIISTQNTVNGIPGTERYSEYSTAKLQKSQKNRINKNRGQPLKETCVFQPLTFFKMADFIKTKRGPQASEPSRFDQVAVEYPNRKHSVKRVSSKQLHKIQDRN
jgi:hypothetical protein